MRLGIMIYSLQRALAEGSLTVPQAFDLMRELGAEGVDVSTGHVEGYTPAQVGQMAAEAGLEVSCWISGGDLCTAAPRVRAASLDHLRRAVEEAAEAGARTLLATTGGRAPGQEAREARRNVAAGLAELLPPAAAAQVTLCIEDYGGETAAYQTAEECLECCEWAGPGLRLTYDSGNMVMGDDDPVRFLQVVQDRVVHAHAKDWELLPPGAEGGLPDRSGRRYRGTVVGQGLLDYPAIIAGLRAMDYRGFLSFEYEGAGDPVAAAREGMAYLQDLIRG